MSSASSHIPPLLSEHEHAMHKAHILGRISAAIASTAAFFMFQDVEELLDGGHHMDEHTMSQRRQYHYESDLPCRRILADVAKNDYQRPPLSKSRMQVNI